MERWMPKDLLERLSRTPLVCDGAMGTMLYAKGVYINRCYDEVNLTSPELVGEIHRAYVHAGAEVIETNSFGANPLKLARHGLEERIHEINRRAAEIAKEAAATAVYVLGAIGPLGIRMEPWGPTSVAEAQAFFEPQVKGLLEGGVDGFLLETFGDVTEARAAMEAVRNVAGDVPLLVQMTVDREGSSLYGTTPEAFGERLAAFGADAIGVNCSVGPHAMLNVLERLRTVTDLPLTVQPNAGTPRAVDDRSLYLCTPDYLEKFARRFLDAGARLLGGCCGTTPDHIRALAKAVKRSRATLVGGPSTTGAHAAVATKERPSQDRR